MTDIADHPKPCLPLGPGTATMTVNLAPFGMPGRCERLIVAPSPEGDYVVCCLPFFTYGIQYGDLVKVREYDREFECVLKSAGLRTLRFAFKDPGHAEKAHERLHGKLVASGLPHEWHRPGYLAVLIRNLHDQERAFTCLAGLLDAGHWEVDPEPFQTALAEARG